MKIKRAFFLASDVDVGPVNRSNNFQVLLLIFFIMPPAIICVLAVSSGLSLISWSSSNDRFLGILIKTRLTGLPGVSRLFNKVSLSVVRLLQARLVLAARCEIYESDQLVRWLLCRAVVIAPKLSLI